MRKAPDGLSWLVGARMLGMSRRARVTLREWLEGGSLMPRGLADSPRGRPA